MRGRIALAWLCCLGAAGAARAGGSSDCPDDCVRGTPSRDAPYQYPSNLRLLAGPMFLPTLGSAGAVLTADWELHTLGGAFSTGTSASVAVAGDASWAIQTLGLFAQVDVTYILLSGGWRCHPPSDFPVRLQLGSRLGADLSESFPQHQGAPYAPTYWLVRPELQSFVDLEFPHWCHRSLALVLRGALDTSVDLTTLFRWSVSLGFSYGWNRG